MLYCTLSLYSLYRYRRAVSLLYILPEETGRGKEQTKGAGMYYAPGCKDFVRNDEEQDGISYAGYFGLIEDVVKWKLLERGRSIKA
jgi:hypothetical protein